MPVDFAKDLRKTTLGTCAPVFSNLRKIGGEFREIFVLRSFDPGDSATQGIDNHKQISIDLPLARTHDTSDGSCRQARPT